MRILHVIPFLWSGAGSVVTRLCEAQARTHDVGIVTSGRSKGFTDWPEYRKRLRAAGVRHFEIDFFDRDPAVFWPSLERFGQVLREHRPDILHCHSGVPACAAAISGHPFLGHLHSWGVDRPSWMNQQDLWGFRRALRVLCGSRAYQRVLIDGGVSPSRLTYLPWGLPLEEIQSAVMADHPGAPARWLSRHPSFSRRGIPLLRQEGWRPRVTQARQGAASRKAAGVVGHANHFNVGFLGRIEPRKGQMDLVKSYFKFQRRYPNSRLELVGPTADKKYENELRQLIGNSEAVKLTGRVANPYSRMATWNLFTSLSSDEGQGLAILEAMALGVPVLARRVAGVEDYLEDQRTGLAVDSTSPAEVADRMEWASQNQKKLARVAARAKEMVEQQYNWETMLVRMNAIYGC